jgi:hypothetical protein
MVDEGALWEYRIQFPGRSVVSGINSNEQRRVCGCQQDNFNSARVRRAALER